jgi:hypothetical protein
MSRQSWGIAHALLLVLSTTGRLRAEEAAVPPLTPAQAERRIEEILDGPLRSPLDFAETPLSTILHAISEEYSIPVVFDVTALEAVAQSPETEVTIAIGDVTLRSALDLMLNNVSDVTYMVDNEVLLITTKDEEQTRLEVRVYRIDDFNSPDVRGPVDYVGSGVGYYDSLVEIIADSVEPHTWQENGTGEGVIAPFGSGILVISQTRRVHRQVEDLLRTLRENRAAIAADWHGDDAYITSGVKIYDETIAHDAAVRDAIRDVLLASVDWTTNEEDKDANVQIQVLPDRVIVRHRPKVVRQVLSLLDDIGIDQTKPFYFRRSSKARAPAAAGDGQNASPQAAGQDATQRGSRGGF